MASLADHEKALTKLCRICGYIISSDSKKRKSFTLEEKLCTRIKKILSIDISLDKNNVHPKQICTSCYTAMRNIEKGL